MEQRYRPRRSLSPRTRFDVASAQRATRLRGRGVELPHIHKGVLVVLALFGFAMLVFSWMMGDEFHIHDIEVQNNQGVPVAQIIGASGLTGEHALFVDLTA